MAEMERERGVRGTGPSSEVGEERGFGFSEGGCGGADDSEEDAEGDGDKGGSADSSSYSWG